jgi:uncharacterized membrane protein
MKAGKYFVRRLIGRLIGVAAVLTIGVTAFVYSGQEHREAMQGIAREFFVLVERASRVRRAPANALVSPTPEGGKIQ